MNSLNQSEFLSAHVDEHDEISLLDLLQVIAENLRVLILIPLLIGLIALGAGFLMRPTYTASTQFLPPQMQQSAAASMLQSLGALGGMAGAAAGLKNPVDQYVGFLKSRAVIDALVERFDIVDKYELEFIEDARKNIESRSSIVAGKDGLISVSFEDHDPHVAAEIANAYVVELNNLLSRLSITEAQQRRVFFEKQLDETKRRLVDAEKALAASGISISVLNTRPDIALEGPARLRAQVTAQEVKLASMRTYLTESAPQFKQAMNELMALKAQLSKAEKQQSQTSVNDGGEYINKFREFKYQETLFELFARQYEMAKIDEGKEGAVIQIVDVAVPPDRKTGPKKALIAIAATLASGFLMLMLVFVRHAIQQGTNNPETNFKMKKIKQSFRKSLGLV